MNREFEKLVRPAKVLLVLFLFWLPISFALANFLVVEKPVDRPDAIVVLGGSAEYVERTSLASSLFRQGRTGKIILTNDGKKGGWDTEQQRNPYFVERARANLIAGGVPAEALIILPDITDGTDEEAAVVLRFAQSANINSLQLITSAYHSRRALWIFESARERSGASVTIGVTSAQSGHLDPSSYVWWLTPDGWCIVLSEYLKMAYFVISK